MAVAVAVFPIASLARDSVRVIPLASVAVTTDGRGTGSAQPSAFEAGRPKPEAAPGAALTVQVDRAKVIRLPERTQTVIIGNPAVADIAIQKSGVVVLTGKSFGVTNFIALDNAGGQIAESMVSVSAPSDSTLLVQRGLERQTYSCTPVCHPSVALGDATGYFGETKGQVDQHNAFVTQR